MLDLQRESVKFPWALEHASVREGYLEKQRQGSSII